MKIMWNVPAWVGLMWVGLTGPFNLAWANFNGSWQGQYLLDGAGWPMRIHVTQGHDDVTVRLDIPNMVYASVPTTARIEQGLLHIDLPFGLKTVSFKSQPDRLVAKDPMVSTDFKATAAPPYRVEPIQWQVDGTVIKGSFYRPDKTGPMPLLIRLHGSSTGHRGHWEYASWGDYFARLGIATVVFDRRGEGQSQGASPVPAGFETLSQDVVALLQKMVHRDDIDRDKIILNGGSQAAYLALMANAASDEVDYLLLSGASSVGLVEQERLSLAFRMRANQEPPAMINQALGYQDLYFHYVRTGSNWEALQAAITQHQDQPWTQYTDQPRTAADLDWWRNNHQAFQPTTLLAQLTTPTLLIYGEMDPITPPSIMIAQFKHLLSNAPPAMIEYVVCKGVGHGLEEPFRRNRWGQVVFPQKSPMMFAAIERWLQRHQLVDP